MVLEHSQLQESISALVMTLHETERRSDYISNSCGAIYDQRPPPHLYSIPPFLLHPSTFMGRLLSFIVSLNPLPSNSFSKFWSRRVRCDEFNLAALLFSKTFLLGPPLYYSAFIPYFCSSFMFLFIYFPALSLSLCRYMSPEGYLLLFQMGLMIL